MKNKRLKILISNDDGFQAKGFKVVCKLCARYGDVVAIAPKEPQSGKSAALSMGGTKLWLKKESSQKCSNGHTIEIYSFTGTPVDCVKIAMNTIFSMDNRPDLLIAGINHGSNASAAAVYSGTLGAAKEGTIYSVPSIALSLDSHDPDASFAGVKKYFPLIMSNFFAAPPKEGTFLNINFPDIPTSKIKGMVFATQGNGMWIKEFDEFKNSRGQKYYVMRGEFLNKDKKPYADHLAVENGYISVAPQKVDITDYEDFERLSKKWKLKVA